MATVNKDFKIKYGLVVEGTTGTINGVDILTKNASSDTYIINLIGGTATPDNTPDTVVKRDGSGNFAAGTVTVNRLNIGSVGYIEDDGAIIIANTDGDDIQLEADDIRLNAQDDVRLTAGVGGNTSGDVVLGAAGKIRLESSDVFVGTNFDYPDSDRVATRGYVDDAVETATDTLTNHINATEAHGATGAVVGTTNEQTLTNKTLGAGTNLSVALDMNGNKIEDLGTPTAGTDATTKNYVDDADIATLGSANSYTDGRETAITTAYEAYADQAEVDAKAYTDTRETAITSAYQTYANNAAADALTDAEAYADQAELDAIATAASDAAALYAPLAGATFTGEVILHSDPTQALGAATKQYVDAVSEGLHIHESVVAATTANVNIATDLEPGDLVDGVTLAQGNRVLVKSQTNAAQNGIYVVQTSGAALRAADFNEPLEVDGGDFIFVTGGNTYDNTGWVQTTTNVVTIGTDPIVFTQFSGAGTYLAGTGLELNGNVFEINDTYTATKSYVDDEITDLDTSLKAYADQAETDAKAYTDTRETAITNAYQSYADTAEADAKSYADGVALTAENDAKAYTDTREGAITTAYQNYADLAEADAKLYTDTEINALNTDDIEEVSGATNKYFTNQRAIDAVSGTITDAINALDTDDIEEGLTNLYHTTSRAKSAAADLLTSASLTNITITGTGAGLTITAENGVADSDTDDLDEGSTNLYFSDERAVDAIGGSNIQPLSIDINTYRKEEATRTNFETASTATVHSFTAPYGSVKYVVRAVGTIGGTVHSQIVELLVTVDGNNNVAVTEYGSIHTTEPALASFTVDYDGVSNFRLRATTTGAMEVVVAATLLSWAD